MITLENIYFSIKDKDILQNISYNFEAGKIHLILGTNGAGKSTLIKLLSGEQKPTKGNVLFDNKNLQQIPTKKLAKSRAVLSQNIDLSFPLSVQEVVLMGRYPHFQEKPDAQSIKIVQEAMDLFSIEYLKERNYLTLSGGEKQRVQFARVFTQIWQKPESSSRLLLLDEPLSFLDIFYQYDLMDKIKNFININTDLTVIGVVHDINIAAKYADNIILLKEKKIFNSGNANTILNEQNIYDVFKVKIKNYFKVDI